MSLDLEGAGPDRSLSAAAANENPVASNVVPLHPAVNAAVKVVVGHAMSEQPAGLPAGYFQRDGYICTLRVTKDGEEDLTQLCPAIVVEARYRLKDGQGWGRVISFTDPDGRQHRLHVLDRDLAARPQEVLAQLADKGFELPFGKAARDALLILIRSWRPSRTLSSVSTFGWTDEAMQAFVQRPDKVIGGDDVIAGFDADPGIVGSVQEAGTLEDWRDRVGALCSGNPMLVFTVSVAFVGPLLAVLGLPGCGLHLYGNPGKGKSTALCAAASVFGDRSFLGSWNITKNAVECHAAARNHTVLILDEIREASAATLAEVIYMVGNGQGKARAGLRGETTPRARFRLAILSSGELSSRDHGAVAGRAMPDGTAIRLIDVRADGQQHGAFDRLHGATSAAEFARRIDRATQEVFGTAGRHFIESLIRNREKKDTFRRAHRNLMGEMRNAWSMAPDGQVERAIERFAAVALAGELATKAGLTGWKRGEAKAAATSLLQTWLTNRTEVDGLSAREVLETTQDWIRKNAGMILTQDDYDTGTIAAPFRVARDRTWIYVATDLWASIHGAVDATAAARALVKVGVMDHGDGRNIQHKSPRWIPGRRRVYRLRLSAFEEVLKSAPE